VKPSGLLASYVQPHQKQAAQTTKFNTGAGARLTLQFSDEINQYEAKGEAIDGGRHRRC
jgi:hypothetical protein